MHINLLHLAHNLFGIRWKHLTDTQKAEVRATATRLSKAAEYSCS